MSLLIIGLAIAAAVAIGEAFKKHGTLTAVLASAKREAAYIEALAGKVEADAVADFKEIAARLKAL